VAASGSQSPISPTVRLASESGAVDDRELSLGDDAFERGDFSEAERHYQSARAVAPRSPGASVGLARVRIARLDLPLDYAVAKGNAVVMAAAADLARTVKAAPAFGPASVELGRALLLLGEAPRALAALDTGTRLLDGVAEAHSQLGVAYLAVGRSDDSVKELTRAVALDPQSSARRGNLGTALLMAGRTQEAIGEYEARVRMDDGDARAHSDLGTALLGTQDLKRALAELERAVQIDPKRAAFHSNLGFALQQSGHVDRALAEYREALRLEPNLVGAWINLGTALARDAHTRGQARAAFDRASVLSPDDPRIKANLQELDALEAREPPRR
jgi:tetratricopeptide (TPR) repeat protein